LRWRSLLLLVVRRKLLRPLRLPMLLLLLLPRLTPLHQLLMPLLPPLHRLRTPRRSNHCA
jgi:hypothetical protein